MEKTRQLSGIFFALTASVLWAVANVIIRHLTANIHPVIISAGLYLSALTLLVPLSALLWSRADGLFPPLWRPPRPRLIVALAKMLEALGFIYAVVYISATRTTILTKLNVLWTFLILLIFYRQEVGLWSLGGSLVVFLGVFVVTGGLEAGATLTREVLLGSGLAVLSGLAMAVFSVALSKDPASGVPVSIAQRLRFTAVLLGMVVLLLLPLVIARWPETCPPAGQLFRLWFCGAFCIGLVYYCYYGALQRISSLLAVVIISFTIPFTLLIEGLFFPVEITWSLVAGALLIVCGVVSVSREYG